MTTAYDEIAYPSTAFRQTHPDRLAAHAMLFGLPFARLDRPFRVLDIGGGDGANAIPMAVAYPQGHFVSFDLSQTAVARGRAIVEGLGLTNAEVIVGDITNPDLGDEPFDYIIAHGVYSWIPGPVREAMMALIRARLAPSGVGFISYNAYPGARLREIVREMLLHHLRGVEGVEARLRKGRAYLEWVLEDYPTTDPFQAALKLEIKSLLERPPYVMAHDELGEVYHPASLQDFQAHALSHGLQFLTEAEPRRAGEGFRPPKALDDPDYDVIAHAQELDFRMLRPFRQSLVVHAEVELDRRPRPERLFDMHVSAWAKRNEAGVFEGGITHFEITDAKLASAVERLSEAWPASLPVREVIDDAERAGALLRMYWADTVELHPGPQPYHTAVSDRPTASPLARWQARTGAPRMTTLRHGMVEIPDDFSRRFVAGLDGTRGLDALARDVAEQMGRPLDDDIRAQLAFNLEALARMPLLIA